MKYITPIALALLLSGCEPSENDKLRASPNFASLPTATQVALVLETPLFILALAAAIFAANGVSFVTVKKDGK